MNTFEGTITEVNVENHLSLVRVDVDGILFTSIVIDTPDSAEYLQVGGSVQVIFKETEVIIGSGEQHQVSLRNKIEGSIQEIKKGVLLSKIIISTKIGPITSLITSGAVDHLGLEIGKTIVAMIKTNEILLSTC